MNPYALRRKHLKLVRLPISPPPHTGWTFRVSRRAEPKLCSSETFYLLLLAALGRGTLRLVIAQNRVACAI